MLIIAQAVNTLIFLFISGLHFYWAFGSSASNMSAVIPEIKGKFAFKPSKLATLVVAIGLLLFAFISWYANSKIEFSDWLKVLNLVIGAIFLLRAIGDFNYVGIFKKIKGTQFAENDTKYYSPLCLVISFLAFYIGI